MDRLLFNPEWFYSEKLKEKVSLKIPFLILLMFGIFAAVSSSLLVNKISESVPSNLIPYIYVGMAIGVVSSLVGAYLIWVILAGVFYLISSLFDSDGTFKRTFEFVGYGFLPLIFSSLIGIGAIYTVLPSLDFSLNDPSVVQQNMNQILANPILQASQVATILLVLWSAYIWIFAVKNAMNITTRNALIVVGIPVGIYIVYSSYNLIINVI
jgi:hypothetical protein